MCWIQISVAVYRMIGSPFGFRKSLVTKLCANAGAGCAIIKFYIPQIVLVATLQMDQFSKNTFAHHVHYRHYIPAVANIFKHAYMCFLFFRFMYNFPMIIKCNTQYYFCANIFYSRLQTVYNHWAMPLPR